jgi:hypothetical protein
MKKQNSSESGQILVLLVVGMVVLLGFSALAIDGGLVYSERRHAQNASDAAALAGGGNAGLVLDQVQYVDFTCSLSDVTSARQAAVAAAINRAASNDFAIVAGGGVDPLENEVVTECTVFNNGGYEEKYIDVKVKVADDVDTALIHFVYKGQVRNVVDSVTRIYPRTPLGFGDAIVSLSTICQGNDGGITFDGGGGSVIDIQGGGIFSNSCIEVNGTSLDVCIDEDPHGTCDGDGDVGYVTTYTESGSPVLDADLVHAPEPMAEYDIPEPDCSSLPDRGQQMGGGAIQPGRYSRIRLPNGNLTMAPGLYCLYGEFTVNGGTLTGSDVTIFMANGDFSTAGNATQILDAPPADCSSPGCPPAIPGMLIYMAESNSGNVTLQGDAGSDFEGAVYVPSGTIDLGGGSSTMAAVHTQLIGYTVKIHGNVTIDINYDDNVVFKLPATLDMYR